MEDGEIIFLGSDHAGFALKEKIKGLLAKKGMKYEDLGPYKLNKKDDYPDYAFKVAEKVSQNKNSKGILICGSGIGMEIAANKVRGIRAAAAYDHYTAKFSREDNNANVLSLRARKFPFQKIKRIINVWLDTDFNKEERHIRRIHKIDSYKNQK
jgi:ribose 5-phosphate isomerase B